MKILVVAPTPFFSDRGTHIRILEEALALEKLGHQITIATYHIGKDIHKNIETKIDIRRILRLLFWYKKIEAGPDWQKIILDIMLIRKVFYLARTQKPDIIHAHLHEGVLIGWLIQKILFWREIKLVADFHGSLTKEMVSHGYLKSGLKKLFSQIEKIINQLGDWAITSSWEMTEEIKRVRNDNRIETILDGTNTESFKLEKTKQEIQKELEIPEKKSVIIYTGGLIGNKGILDFLIAAKDLIEKRKDVFFLIGGFPREHVLKFIQKNNLPSDAIRLVVPLDYFLLPEFLKAADIAVDPKGSEVRQASGKMLNYMSASLPIVCFDKENNRQFLGDGGYFSEKQNAEGIRKGIEYFLDNPEEAERMGNLNQKNAENFSWEKSALKINNIYQKICYSQKETEKQNQ